MTITVQHGERAFDPADPYSAMCENFRRQIIEMVLAAERITIFRELPLEQQLSAQMAGILTGLLCVCLASVEKRSRDDMMTAISAAMPLCRAQAEGIIGLVRR